MMDFKGELRCHACGSLFSVQLAKMRFRVKHPCPSCGAEYAVSERQAIKAHRTLDELEHIAKTIATAYADTACLKL